MPNQWDNKWDEWKRILAQPKNLGLQAGKGTGIGAQLKKVSEEEDHFTASKAPGGMTAHSFQLLQHELQELAKICKATSDKHKKLFTTACAFLDTLKTDATDRITVAAREVDQVRNEISQHVGQYIQQVRGCNVVGELRTAWLALYEDFHKRAAGFPLLNEEVTKIANMTAKIIAPGEFSIIKTNALNLAGEVQKKILAAR